MSSSEAPPSTPPAGGRGPANPLSAFLRRLRIFLAAPLVERLARIQAEQAEAFAAHVQAGLAQLQGQFDLLHQRIDGLERRADHMQDTIDRRTDQLQVLVDGRADQLLATVDSRSDQLRDTAESRTDRLLATIDGRADQIQATADGRADQLQDAIERRGDQLQASVDRRADALEVRADAAMEGIGAVRDFTTPLPSFTTRLDDHAVAQAYVARQTTEADRRTAAALARAEAALATFSARFDELDIKSRPLIPYDADSWAIRVREGYILAPRTDPVFSTALADASSGGLEPGTRRVLRALIEPGMGVADVGANIGLLTLACAFATGPSGRVWSFEPEARLRAQLVKTLHLNGLSWVALSGAAVGAEAGKARFNVSPVIGHSSLHPLPEDEQAQAETVEVEVATLDDVVSEGERLDVVKIDVEGAELDVLAGMTRLLAENADLAVVAEYGPSHLARLGQAANAWFGAFAAHGFIPYLIEEPFGACRALDDDRSLVADVHSANILFVRPGGAAEARLPQA